MDKDYYNLKIPKEDLSLILMIQDDYDKKFVTDYHKYLLIQSFLENILDQIPMKDILSIIEHD